MKYISKILLFTFIIITAAMTMKVKAYTPTTDNFQPELPSDKKELLRWYIDNYIMRQKSKLDLCDATIRNFRIIDSIPELDAKRKDMLYSMFIDMYLDKEADSIKARRFYDTVKPILSDFPEADKKLKAKVELITNQTKNGDPFPFYPTLYRPDGSSLSLQDALSDRYTYIDIWATTCGPCRKELPILHELCATYPQDPYSKIKFISISTDNKLITWQKFLAGKESAYEQYFMNPKDGARLLSQMRILGIPRFILVGPNKRIVNINAPKPSEIKNGNPILQNLR